MEERKLNEIKKDLENNTNKAKKIAELLVELGITDISIMDENMGIVYKDKDIERNDYKCKVLSRTINEEWKGVKEGNWPRPTPTKVKNDEYLTLIFDNKHGHNLNSKNLWVITSFGVLGRDYRNEKGEEQNLKYWEVIQWEKVEEGSTKVFLKLKRDKERELEVFGSIDRIESDISNTELLGILKDRILKKEIDALCWPGSYWREEYKKSAMYPVSVRFWIGDTKETDFTIYISESGIFDADDNDVKSYKDTKLVDATTQQLQKELEKRNKELVSNYMNRQEIIVCYDCQGKFYLAKDEKPIIKNSRVCCGECG